MTKKYSVQEHMNYGWKPLTFSKSFYAKFYSLFNKKYYKIRNITFLQSLQFLSGYNHCKQQYTFHIYILKYFTMLDSMME